MQSGHNPPLVGRRNGNRMDWQYLQLGKKSRALGAFDDLEYEMRKLTLMPGDMLFLYTDGVTEAVNEAQVLYSEERLQRVLNQLATSASSAQEIIADIHADIDAYANGAEQFDDITMLGIRFEGKGTE